ncbi:MAG: RecQ family ATP-dependent DNA helicase, partial [Bdellovibrionota bacterium]
KKGSTFILYVSPERAQKPGFQTWIKSQAIALFAVDEAHCVSQWGHDFREDYALLKILKEIRPDVPVLALTASATPFVLNDIAKQLALKKPQRHVHGFYRPNLYYQVETCTNEEEKLALLQQALIQFGTGRVIIYCGTRKVSEELAETLGHNFRDVAHYHAGLSPAKRTEIQEAYANGEIRILTATNAFGMGIDHPDVRLVVHYQMPANIDSLYQEMGRAGRDNKNSTCLMLYAKRDKGLQSFFIQQSKAPENIQASRWRGLDNIVSYAEGGECRHAEILTYYQDSQRLEKCGHCDVCDPVSARRVQRPVTKIKVKLKKAKSSAGKSAAVTAALEGDELQLFEHLRKWRKAKAKEMDMPAFVVLSDKSLRHLASAKPKTISELHEIYGLGEHKIEKFGDELLSEVLLGGG